MLYIQPVLCNPRSVLIIFLHVSFQTRAKVMATEPLATGSESEFDYPLRVARNFSALYVVSKDKRTSQKTHQGRRFYKTEKHPQSPTAVCTISCPRTGDNTCSVRAANKIIQRSCRWTEGSHPYLSGKLLGIVGWRKDDAAIRW